MLNFRGFYHAKNALFKNYAYENSFLARDLLLEKYQNEKNEKFIRNGLNLMKKDWNDSFGLNIWAEKLPHKKAIITEQTAISYLELHNRSNQLAAVLQKKGLNAGDSILLFMPNCIEYTIVFFAAVKLHLNIALANALYKNSELIPLIQATNPKFAFVINRKEAEQLQSTDQELTAICVPELLNTLENSELSDQTIQFPSEEPKDACIYISTSGSTGKPKVISNSYKSEYINASLYVDTMQVTEEDVILTALPATHRFGMAAMLGNCIKGATAILVPKFRAANMLALIEKYRVSVQYGVPTMFLKEIETYESAETIPDISSLRTGVVAGANCSEDLFKWFENHTRCRLLNCYGTSEIGGLTMVNYNDPDIVRHHTCGQVLRDAVIEIIDCQGNVLPNGKKGEVICYVPWVMNGYVGEPELTANMFDERGYFLTGDIGKLDENGNLIISGRKKDLIIRGGYNIFPAELEHALRNLPDIQEACVMGYKDCILGERIVAFVNSIDKNASEEKTVQELSNHIAKYKLPDHIFYMEEIPKLPNGKFDCLRLKAFIKEKKLCTLKKKCKQ